MPRLDPDAVGASCVRSEVGTRREGGASVSVVSARRSWSCCGGNSRSRSGGGSWRYNGCWCWSRQTRTNHVIKTSDHLLVPLAGGLHTGDEETAFILVSDYRAANERLGCAFKHVHRFAEQ